MALADRYAVERVLGQGGSAIVCLAQDLRHSRPVAIKVLRPEVSLIVGADRFLHEIETVARLQHPHILPLYDSGEAAGLLYFVMPYVTGESLRDRLERDKQLPIQDVVTIAREIASALSFAHERGVVHRDIKPENVMLFGGAAVVADFGIARVLPRPGVADPRRTDHRLAHGTPLYMSPEQAAAGGDVDGRSDIYSLACVVYEMLGGSPPFTGVSPTDVLAHHVHDPPRPIAELRSTVPPQIALAVAKALAKLPADRFQRITDFAEALQLPSGDHAPVRRLRAVRWLVAAAAVAGLSLVVRQLVGDASLDPARYAVLPLTEESARAAPDGLKGENVAMLMRSALSRWSDITVASDVLVSDALASAGGPQLTFRKALGIARRLGAGRLVWGGQYAQRDSVRLSIGLYDVRHGGRRIREVTVVVAPVLSAVSHNIGALADSLLADRVALRFGAAPIGTTSRDAWNAYAAGQGALSRWDLAGAAAAFDRATTIDPQFALAQLWTAQVRSWQRQPEEQWLRPAQSAVALANRFSSARDSNYAQGLLALAEQRYQEACRRYRNVLDRDSTDVVALMGLGECNIRDRTVVRSRSSPTGWVFRGSVATAIRAYGSALELAPAFSFTFGNEAYQRLSAMFYVQRYLFRWGHAAAPDSGRFAAFLSLEGDSLVFIPDHWNAVMGRPVVGATPEALASTRESLRQLLARWLQDFPSRSEPHATLALLLELTGSPGPSTHGEPTALDEIVVARRLVTDSLLALRHAMVHVRLLVKIGAMAQARALSDSLLARWQHPPAGASSHLAGLAALLGRADQAAALVSVSDTALRAYQEQLPQRAPVELIQTARRLSSYAGFGGPRDSLVRLAGRVSDLVVRYIEPANRGDAWSTLTDGPLMIAFLDMPRPAGHRRSLSVPLMQVEDLVARGDNAEALRRLRVARDQLRQHGLMGEIAPSVALLESRLMLALGDSTGAEAWLRSVLDNLPMAPTALVEEPAHAASLVRAMALAAELAEQRGDRSAARRWATNVVQLWSDGDPAWQPLVSRLRAIAQ